MSGYQPDTRQRLKAATRFFARPESFTLECPHCGIVYQVRTGIRSTYWNPSTARFWCTAKTGCNRRYVIGMVAWPIQPAPHAASTIPDDQVPSPRHLAQMRADGGGWWMPDEESKTKRRTHESNLTTEEERPDDDADD